MLCVRQRSCPVDYSKCNQTVTVYHQNAPGDYTKAVYHNAFLDYKKTQNIDKTGSREVNSFLLIVPCSKKIVCVGDKVVFGAPFSNPRLFCGDKIIAGEWPDINTREEWAAFIPAKVPGLVIAGYVDPKYWGGKMIHLEAGG